MIPLVYSSYFVRLLQNLAPVGIKTSHFGKHILLSLHTCRQKFRLWRPAYHPTVRGRVYHVKCLEEKKHKSLFLKYNGLSLTDQDNRK